MPVSVVIASTLQYALAVLFLVLSVLVHTHGERAQRAAEAVVTRQGLPAGVLARHGVKFAESVVELLFPLAICAALATLASLGLAGSGAGRTLSWIAAALLMTAGAFVTGSQVFAARYVEAAFKKSKEPGVRELDGGAVVRAAQEAFPAILRPLIVLRFVLTTAGSPAVIVLLATPAASAYFQ
ncbi:hypothetical protein AB0J35_45385 [Nonomuraea angiospora]|uniref:hypothetical protein n=1 Tax=Nonomuraea angiospora TaxID=46172 RepID=UPI003437D889